ncbi:MAG: hypothetical protein KBT03_12455 [Bacteroidales bacterium]|nr:hypothetical protein [Candidatus Scybalousia scybalohippi]
MIQNTKNNSKKYFLKKDVNGIVELTKDNAARVEAMIAQNSRYNKNTSAEWFIEINKLINQNNTECYYVSAIKEAMKAINKENSTRLSDKEIDELANRVYKIPQQGFISLLKRPYPGYYLIDILSKPTQANRRNYSFATKFCHYACLTLFAGNYEEDNFSIYDSVVEKTLPKYAKKYKINMKKDDMKNYQKFIGVIDAIIKKSGAKISRYDFDHIMWYVNK